MHIALVRPRNRIPLAADVLRFTTCLCGKLFRAYNITLKLVQKAFISLTGNLINLSDYNMYNWARTRVRMTKREIKDLFYIDMRLH